MVAELANSEGSNAACIQQACDAGRLLDHRGFDRPAWHLLAAGARPPLRDELPEPCERVRGWQFHACSAIETFHREQALLPVLPPAHRALLRSSSGSGAAHWLLALPTSPEATMRPEVMQTALRRRLCFPLPVGAATCPASSCRRRLDNLGDYLVCCTRAGGVQRRTRPLERAWQCVFREVGARVVVQPFLRDLDVSVGARDGRRVDMVARGLPLYGGLLLCGDVCIVSVVRGDGSV